MKIKSSVVVEEDVWKEFKIICIREKKDISEYLQELMTRIIKEKKQT